MQRTVVADRHRGCVTMQLGRLDSGKSGDYKQGEVGYEQALGVRGSR